jgi:hypothetical protein
MKRVTKTTILAVFCLILVMQLSAQTINQKLITGIPNTNGQVDAYSLKYDAATGGWAYAAYDTTTTKFTIITPKGTSKPFNYAMTYNAMFDAEGNSYIIGSENITDTVYRYSVLKNSDVIAEYDYVIDGWVIKDNVIYYAASEGGKSFMVMYDTRSGQFTKGKAYDEIRLAYTPDGYSEGEPMGYVGFTKSGSVYYIARENNESFLVIGDTEQKHYSDITWYDLKFNSGDVPCYIARSQGKFYEERGNTFVVLGDKEYKQFDWVYGPLSFDNSGTPIYVGQDSAGEYKYSSTLMHGETAVEKASGSIYNYGYNESGKFYYIISEESTTPTGEYVYAATLVIDGKKSKKYSSINYPVFNKKGDVLFSASDKSNKYFVVLNGEVISDKYDYISEAKFMPDGTIGYVGVKYGNYDKNIADKSYVVVDGEVSGPYNAINTADWKTNQLILTNGNNYSYLAGELTDKLNYTYKYTVVTNKGESKAFDNISDLKYVNNKLVYFAGNTVKKDLYIYDYSLYVNNKKLGDTYSAYTDVIVKNDGTMTFIASKGNDMYYVEAKP